jgi:hypothetical protein
MKSWVFFRAMLAVAAILLTGCSTTGEVQPAVAQRKALFPFPQQAAESIRLIIYRPQVLVGMSGKPVIFVNGQRMGNPGSPVTENHLQPGTVFVVDAPASLVSVSWSQSAQREPIDKPISYTGLSGAKRYLRWTRMPTYGYLQEIDEAKAIEEIGPLRFSAYVNLLSQN